MLGVCYELCYKFRTKIFSISNAVVEGVLLILNGQVDNGHICRVEGIGGVEFVKVELRKGNYLVVGIDEVTCSFDFLESSQPVRLQLVLDLLQKRRGKYLVSGTQQQPTQLITAACASHRGNQIILFTFPLTPSVCVCQAHEFRFLTRSMTTATSIRGFELLCGGSPVSTAGAPSPDSTTED